MGLPTDEKNKIVQALAGKHPTLSSPICKCEKLILADGYIRDNLQQNMKDMTIGGIGIPQVAVICNNCGFIMNFSAGILGLMAAKEESNISS